MQQVFHKKFISHRNEKTQILINKAVSLGISILDMSKNVIYEFWYDYLKRVWSKCKAIWIQTASLFM